MSPVVGHQAAVRLLEQALPSVTLLWGPPSVGKWTLAEHARAAHKISEPDVLRVRHLDASAAREVGAFAATASVRPAGKVALIRLDGAADATMATLLKATEEAHDQMHFLLVSSHAAPSTLVDRSICLALGLLSVEEVTDVLVRHRGMSYAAAQHLAEQSGGQVSRALEAAVGADDKTLVLACVRTLREDDRPALEALADRWRQEHTELLAQWATEAVTRRWRRFNEAETGDVGNLPLRVLAALRTDTRPRLTVRAVLGSLLRRT